MYMPKAIDIFKVMSDVGGIMTTILKYEWVDSTTVLPIQRFL